MFITTPRIHERWHSQRPKTTTTEIPPVEEKVEWSLERFLDLELTIPEFITLAVVFGIVVFLLAYWLGMYLIKTCTPVTRGQYRRMRIRNATYPGHAHRRQRLQDSDADTEPFFVLVKEGEQTVVKEVNVVLCDSDEDEPKNTDSAKPNKIKQNTKEMDQAPVVDVAETDCFINVPIDSTETSTMELINEPLNATEQEFVNAKFTEFNDKKENSVTAMVMVTPDLAQFTR